MNVFPTVYVTGFLPAVAHVLLQVERIGKMIWEIPFVSLIKALVLLAGISMMVGAQQSANSVVSRTMGRVVQIIPAIVANGQLHISFQRVPILQSMLG